LIIQHRRSRMLSRILVPTLKFPKNSRLSK
jgi:hypothetical protein